MKKIILLLMLFWSFFCKAQSPGTFKDIHNAQAIDWLAAVKYLGIPYGPTLTLNGAVRPGEPSLFYLTADSIGLYLLDPLCACWKVVGGGDNNIMYDVLDSIGAIDFYTNANSKALIVKDTARGGIFLKYSGTQSDDDGMIFIDGLSQKWIRQTNDNKINVQWYGAKASAGASNNRAAIISARDYIYNNFSKGILYIPKDTTGGAGYNLSDSIAFNKPIIIEGDGELGFPKSKLIFPLDKNGIVIDYAFPSDGFSTEIKNIYLSTGLSGTGPYNINAHAIKTTLQINIYNVWAYAWGGNGLYISACATPPTGENNNYGNASNSVINYFKANYCTNGIFVEGCDANTIEFRNIDMSQNRRWGVFDNGMLGNLYLKPHFAFNGVPAINGANSVVEYAGKYYSAKPGFDSYWSDAADSNYNKLPTNSTYWYEVPFMTSTVWNDSTRYYSGGPLCIRNANAWSNVVNSYTEAFQPSIYLNPRSKVDGGDNGADVEGGIWHNIYSGIEYIRNGDFAIYGDTLRQSRFAVGSDINAVAPLVVVNDGNVTGTLPVTQFEIKNRIGLLMNFKNSLSTGQIGYSIYDFNFYPNGTFSTQVTTTGVHPGSDSAYDLGAITQRWKRIYGTKFYGDASTATNIPETLSKDNVISGGENDITFNNINKFEVNTVNDVGKLRSKSSDKYADVISGGNYASISAIDSLNPSTKHSSIVTYPDSVVIHAETGIYKLYNVVTGAGTKALRYDEVTKRIYITDTTTSLPLGIGNSVTSSTAGSIFFAGTGGTMQQKNDKFFYDSTNVRLGIGTNTPSTTIHATATGAVAKFASTGYTASTVEISDPDGSMVLTNSQIKANSQPFVLNANSSYLAIQTGGVERMRVLNTGEVGIGTSTPNSTLHVAGSLALKYLLVEVNEYAITEFDYTLSVNNGASDWSIILPDASACAGRVYIIKRFDNNSTGLVTVDANSCDVQSPATGSFNTTFDLTAWGTQNQSVMFQSNGTNWEAIK